MYIVLLDDCPLFTDEYETWYEAVEFASAFGGTVITHLPMCEKWIYWHISKGEFSS